MPLQRYVFTTECQTRDLRKVLIGCTIRYAATSDKRSAFDEKLVKVLRPIVEGQIRQHSLFELQSDLGSYRHLNVGVESVADNFERELGVKIGPVTSFLSEVRS